MKTPIFGPCVLALAVSTGVGVGYATSLPQPPTFSGTPLELPSLGLDQPPAQPTIPLNRHIFERFPSKPTIVSRSPIDRMPIIAPRTDIDYKLIVKAPDPKTDYKMLLKETEPPPTVKR